MRASCATGWGCVSPSTPPCRRSGAPTTAGVLARGLADLQRVLPALDFRGLRVRFGRAPAGSTVLALHDPQHRTVFLPPATGAGTIAHEFAHDLDYQVAERRYGIRGDYATDFATRTERGRLAASVTGLSGATLVAPAPGDPAVPDHAHRPAEVFARSMEWFVAVSLAREGRTRTATWPPSRTTC